MFITMTLVIIRNIFRCAEFAEGPQGYLDSIEIWYMMFDPFLIALAMCTFIILDLGNDWVLPNECRNLNLNQSIQNSDSNNIIKQYNNENHVIEISSGNSSQNEPDTATTDKQSDMVNIVV